MRYFFTIFLFLTAVLSYAGSSGNAPLAREKTYKGRYKGKNLKVRNPYSFQSKAYCISQIYVNGEEVSVDLEKTLVEVDLSHLEEKSSVAVRIVYKSDCTPVAVNLADIL